MINQDLEFILDAHFSKDLEFATDARFFECNNTDSRLLSVSLSDKVRFADNERIVFVLRFPFGTSQLLSFESVAKSGKSEEMYSSIRLKEVE